VFHLLRPLAMCGDRFYRQALAAIAWEDERGGLEGGRSAPVIHKRMESDEAAKAAADEKSSQYDQCGSLWAELRQALAWFDSAGRLHESAARKAESAVILELMRALGCAQLHQAVASFTRCLPPAVGRWIRTCWSCVRMGIIIGGLCEASTQAKRRSRS
jgi:hypothetical protein